MEPSWWMQSRPLCWVAQRSGWPWLGSAFQMAAATDESPAGARKGVCNYIMIPNRLHAFRSFQCCQLTCVSLGLVANEWKWFSSSPQSWGLNDAVRFTLWYLNARICVLCAFSTKSIVGFFVCFVFYTNVPFWPQLIRTFSSKFFQNLYWMS